MTDRKKLDERSERSMPLNVETALLEGRGSRSDSILTMKNEELKKDGSDVETVRGDLEVPESMPQKKCKP